MARAAAAAAPRLPSARRPPWRLLHKGVRKLWNLKGGRRKAIRRPGNSLVGLRTYRQVRYRGVWPGIDVRFRPRRGALRRDFLVRPGADPARIRFRLSGIERLRLARDGSLVMRTRYGVLRQPAPRLHAT
jgi:hypothetical protein